MKEDFTLCFCDFGTAFVAQNCDTRAKLNTYEQAVVDGELHYLAPEVLEGYVSCCYLQLALQQADMYSLGLLLWEMSRRCNVFFTGKTLQ